MAQFKFRLDPIIQLRMRARDSAAQAFQQALQASEQLRGEIERIIQESDSQRPGQSAASQGEVKPQMLLESQRFQVQLKQQVRELEGKLAAIDAEGEKRRKVLVEAERELRSLEKLREREEAAFNLREAKSEQANLDQWAGNKYWNSVSD